MPTMVRSPKLNALGPLLFTVYSTVTHLGSFGPSLPARFFDTMGTRLETTSTVVTPASTSHVHEPTLLQSATRPTPALIPTPTFTIEPGIDIRFLFLTWLTGIALFLSVLVMIPLFYVLFSRLALKTRLRSFTPFLQRILIAIVMSTILLRWPDLQEYPVEEIYNVISCLCCGLLSQDKFDNHSGIDITETGLEDESPKEALFREIKKKYAMSEMASSRVVIVLEKQADGSLWVIEFNHRAPLEDVPSEESSQTTPRLTTANGNEEEVTIDLANIKNEFANAPKLIPFAPWRVVGFHQDPVRISLFSRYDIARMSMHPLDRGHAAEHFAYPRSHDPGVENAFWDSSPTAQGRAWDLIISQSRIFSSSFGGEWSGHGALYLSLGMEPWMDWLRWRISFEERGIALANGNVPAEWIQEDEEEERQHREYIQSADERHRKHVEEIREWVTGEKESRERHEALWRRETRKSKYRSSASAARWSAEGRLRARRSA